MRVIAGPSRKKVLPPGARVNYRTRILIFRVVIELVPVLRFFLRIVAVAVLAMLLSGCKTTPAHSIPLPRGGRDVMQEIMARNNQLVLISRDEFQAGRPVLVLLHGATDDPSEMLLIAREHMKTHNVLLYSYNFNHSIERLAWDFVREIKFFQLDRPEIFAAKASEPALTVVTYSYSTTIFRKAVLLSGTNGPFSSTSLVELVPTAGGSLQARFMRYRINAFLVGLASEFSTAQNPYGRLARELWSDEGTRKFHEVIRPDLMHTVLVENDRHSLAELDDEAVRKRYGNGIATNLVIIPSSSGVTHENFTVHPEGLANLRRILEPPAKKGADMGK
jgi:hypothetical protein